MDELSEGGDHLRVCGADTSRRGSLNLVPGSPPRVRSRHGPQPSQPGVEGITSACAEQTRARESPTTRHRDHLRVCGADGAGLVRVQDLPGSPPRVRSRRDDERHAGRPARITSACAEQTGGATELPICPRDHLRVCGADSFMGACPFRRGGSPPRVRSRLGLQRHQHARRRITSACAEQTT